MNYLLLMMGGSGTRANLGIPKQFYKIRGKEIYLHILDLIMKSNIAHKIVVVCPKAWFEHVARQLSSYNQISIAVGGDSRTESVFNGIKAIEHYLNNDDKILIHDATHPYFDKYAVLELLKVLDKEYAGTLVTHVWDTVYYSNKSYEKSDCTLQRERIAVGASPEGFRYEILKEFLSLQDTLDKSKFTSIGDMLSFKKIPLNFIWSDTPNLKITYKNDLELFEESFDLLIK